MNNILYDFLKNRPTIFNYENELVLIDIIMRLPIPWIKENAEEFRYVVGELALAHTYNFLVQPESDDVIFDRFFNWLIWIEKETGVGSVFSDRFSSDWVKYFRKNIMK